METVPWQAFSPDFMTIEHPWNSIGRKIHQRNQPIQTVAELQAALYQEWVLVTQETNERVFRIMRHGVQAVTNVHVSFVPYCVTGGTVTY